MKGLLYKDYIAYKGKIVSIGLLVMIVLFAIARFYMPGTAGGFTSSVRLSDGTIGASYGYMNDTTLYFVLSTITMFLTVIPIMFCKYLFTEDEKSRSKAYLFSTPVSKKDFVAAKYVAFLIMYYVIISCIMILQMIYKVTAGYDEMIEKADMLSPMSIMLIGILLLVHSLQFPVYLIKGVAKADEINSIIFGVIFLALLPVALFADINRFNPEWFTEHIVLIGGIEAVAYPIVMLLYYLSYRFTVKHMDQ